MLLAQQTTTRWFQWFGRKTEYRLEWSAFQVTDTLRLFPEDRPMVVSMLVDGDRVATVPLPTVVRYAIAWPRSPSGQYRLRWATAEVQGNENVKILGSGG